MPAVAESLVINIAVNGARARSELRQLDQMIARLTGRRFEGGKPVGGAVGGLGLGGGGGLGVGGLLGGIGAGAGLGGILGSAGRMQQLEISLETLLRSREAAQGLLSDLREFDRASPFDFFETAQQAQRLLAMGFKRSELIPTMKAIGDATAAAGGSTETFAGVARAIGQIRTNGRLYREEINQLSERGIPANEILQEELGLTAEQLRRVGEEGIDANRAIQALLRGFEKRFGGAMERQSNTLRGSLSNLKSATDQLAASMGRNLIPTATRVVQGLTKIVDAYNAMPEPLRTTLGVGAVGAAAGTAAFGGVGEIAQTFLLWRMMKGGGGAAGGAAAAGGRMGGIGAAAARFGIPALALGASELGGNLFPRNPQTHMFKRAFQGGIIGGTLGGAIGKSPGAIGAGALLGGILGVGVGSYETGKNFGTPQQLAERRRRWMAGGNAPGSQQPEGTKSRMEQLMEEQNRLLRQLIDQRGWKKGEAFDRSEVPGALQGRIAAMLGA